MSLAPSAMMRQNRAERSMERAAQRTAQSDSDVAIVFYVLAQDKKMAGGYLKISDWFDHSCASQRDSYFTFFSEAFFLRFTVSCDFNRTCFSGELLKGVQLYVDCSGSVSGCGETAVI